MIKCTYSAVKYHDIILTVRGRHADTSMASFYYKAIRLNFKLPFGVLTPLFE